MTEISELERLARNLSKEYGVELLMASRDIEFERASAPLERIDVPPVLVGYIKHSVKKRGIYHELSLFRNVETIPESFSVLGSKGDYTVIYVATKPITFFLTFGLADAKEFNEREVAEFCKNAREIGKRFYTRQDIFEGTGLQRSQDESVPYYFLQTQKIKMRGVVELCNYMAQQLCTPSVQ